jgi:transcriptional regulator GlxA family with amidase domain
MKERFGFLLFNGLEELDFVGPWEMISLWSKEYGGPEELITVSQDAGLVTCAKELKIFSDYSFSLCPNLDYLLIPGGKGVRNAITNNELIDFIKIQSLNCKNILSVCTGVFLLHASGLLTGRSATTHWMALEKLKAIKEINVLNNRYTKDNNIWTSAGVSAGIDMVLAFIAQVSGNEIAGKVQLHAEYFPENKNYVAKEDVKYLPSYFYG